MPVRFRCHYCNQLLGIARRKIGMEVSCPTCHNQVTVPPTDSPDVDQPAVKKDPLFEGSDLDALLQPAVAAPPEPAKMAPPPAPGWAAPPAPPPPASFHVEPYPAPAPWTPPAPAPGVTLSPVQLTMLAVGAVVILALAFAAGLLIGRFMY
jgi:phage FluMu protein Com